MTKVVKNQLSKVMRKAWEIFKAGTKNFSIALKEAWKQVRMAAKALKEGVVTFWKEKTGEVTTRRIAPLADFDYTAKGIGKSTDTIKVVDLDKLAATGEVTKSIISFHAYQILESVDAELIYENLDVPFNHKDCSFDKATNTITVVVETEYDTITLNVEVTADDDCASVADKFRELLEQTYEEAESSDSWVDWQAEQGYGCTGNYL